MRHKQLAAVIAHRGVPTRIAENSVAGIELATQLGYKWCEIDTQSSQDEIAVVYHDKTIVGHGRIRDLTAAQLERISINKEGDSGERHYLPTLATMLETAAACGVGLVVEIKSLPGRERVDAVAVAQALRDGPQLDYMVSSFEPQAIAEFVKLMPDVPVALNTVALPRDPPEWVANIHCSAQKVHPGTVARLLELGYGVYAWTVNSTTLRDQMLSSGVHGVFTDDPQLLATLPAEYR